jgi:phosphoribosylglycinamide formyltransferase 2
MNEMHLKEAQEMADKVTRSLTGAGIWGVEFFISLKSGVYFSELSPRPHDTGMVTLAGTQNFSEFELHARAVLGLPIPNITLERTGASAVVLSHKEGVSPQYVGIENVASAELSDFRIFGKPTTRPYRRMAVVVTYDKPGSDVQQVKQRAIDLAKKVKVESE